MQTLAVGSELARSFGVLPSGHFIALAFFPPQVTLAMFLDLSFVIVVIWIVGASLPLHLALLLTAGPSRHRIPVCPRS